MNDTRIAVLGGGVGAAARFLQGAVEVVPPEGITVVGNGGGDLEHRGLHLSAEHR